jgi:uncharacterized RDD family membrane protein YckC
VAPPLRRRLGSLLYEALVAIAVSLLAVVLFSIVTTLAPRLPHQRPLLLATCFLALAGYYIYCWLHSQTLAMRAWKMRITDMHSRPLSPGRACFRFVLGWVWVAPPLAMLAALQPHAPSLATGMLQAAMAVFAWVVIWALASMLRKDGQFWHDVAAGTRILPA